MDKKKSRTGNLYGLKTNIKFSAIFFSVYFRENCATMTTTKRQYFGEKLQKHNILWHKKDRAQPLGVQHGLLWRHVSTRI